MRWCIVYPTIYLSYIHLSEKQMYEVRSKQILICFQSPHQMSNKARKELSRGRLFSAKHDSMCGVDLKVGVPYIIMGNSARINSCNFVKEYSQATIVERRGIGGAYKKGCACDVMPCWREGACEQVEGECLWNPWNECQTEFGSCIPSRGIYNAEGRPTKCRWRKSSPFLNCVKKTLNHV